MLSSNSSIMPKSGSEKIIANEVCQAITSLVVKSPGKMTGCETTSEGAGTVSFDQRLAASAADDRLRLCDLMTV